MTTPFETFLDHVCARMNKDTEHRNYFMCEGVLCQRLPGNGAPLCLEHREPTCTLLKYFHLKEDAPRWADSTDLLKRLAAQVLLEDNYDQERTGAPSEGVQGSPS